MWMNTPDREVGGKMVCSFGEHETIAKKAVREALLASDNGASWYVGYDAAGQMIPYALIIDRRVEWMRGCIPIFALKRRLKRCFEAAEKQHGAGLIRGVDGNPGSDGRVL
jgi:hypothetical protein